MSKNGCHHAIPRKKLALGQDLPNFFPTDHMSVTYVKFSKLPYMCEYLNTKRPVAALATFGTTRGQSTDVRLAGQKATSTKGARETRSLANSHGQSTRSVHTHASRYHSWHIPLSAPPLFPRGVASAHLITTTSICPY